MRNVILLLTIILLSIRCNGLINDSQNISISDTNKVHVDTIKESFIEKGNLTKGNSYTISSSQKYKLLPGLNKIYNIDGTLNFEGYYSLKYTKNGDSILCENGIFKYYFSNGKLKSEGNFQYDKKIGKWNNYNNSGTIDYIDNFSENYRAYYYLNGDVKSEGQLDSLLAYRKTIDLGDFFSADRIGKWTFYYPNSKVKCKGYFTSKSKTGKWEYYDENGNLIRTETYDVTNKKPVWDYEKCCD
jgi:antitoxin component YwqK of YwqJK toxin-antitoxin module